MSKTISPEQAAKNYGGSIEKAVQKAKELQKIADEQDRKAREAEEQSKNAS